MGPQLAQGLAAASAEVGAEERDERPERKAAKALGVELLELSRERPLSRTWQARRATGGPMVAIVLVADGATADERGLFARMAEDVHAAGDSLPGILPVRGLTPSREAFLTDLLTAGSARDLAALKWSPRRRVKLVLATVRALQGLHAVGLVHGCLCPANVLLDDDLEPVIAEAAARWPLHAFVERGGDGSLYAPFAAPEVTQGGKVEARSDVYSIGRILEEVTKGDESPAALTEIVKHCTYPDVDARYPGAAELATALEGVLGLLSDAEAAGPAPAAGPLPRRACACRPPRSRCPRHVPARRRHAPSFAWRPLGCSASQGSVVFAAGMAGSVLVGGAGDAVRAVLMFSVVVGAALATTLLRPPATASLRRGSTMQLMLAAGCTHSSSSSTPCRRATAWPRSSTFAGTTPRGAPRSRRSFAWGATSADCRSPTWISPDRISQNRISAR